MFKTLKSQQAFWLDGFCLFFLFALLFLLRAPYFHLATVNWDESTFTIIGADLLKGILPYEQLWDIKPPLCFAAYALFLKILGPSVESVRWGGFFFIFISVFLTYGIAMRFFSRPLALLAGLIHVFYVNDGDFYFSLVMNDFYSIMSEHIALLPLSATLALFFLGKESKINAFWLGVTSATMILVRFNLVYFSLGLAVALFLRNHQPLRLAVSKMILCLAGHVFLLGLVMLPYALRGELSLLWKSTIPLYWNYAANNVGGPEIVGTTFWRLIRIDHLGFFLVLLGLALRISQRKGERSWDLPWFFYFLFFFITVSIFQTGAAYPHYLIQLAPLFGLIGADLLASLIRYTQKRWLTFFFILVFLFKLGIAGAEPVWLWSQGKEIFPSKAEKVADYLSHKNVRGKYVFVLYENIIYFLTGSKIPTYFVQPSNLLQPYLLHYFDGPNQTPHHAFQDVFDKKPVYIVSPKEMFYLTWYCLSCYEVLGAELEKNYILEKTIEDVRLYRHKSV